MSVSLDQLLRRIDPDQSVDRIERRAHRAFATFRVPFGRIRSPQRLRLLLSYFEFRLTHWPDAQPEQFPLDQAKRWYQQMYKRMTARFGRMPEHTILYIVQTGVEGGLYGVLRSLTEHYVYEQSQRYVREAVDAFWHSQSGAQRREAIKQYWRHYQRHLLPRDMNTPEDWRLRGDFPSVLRKHPSLVRSRRRIGKAFDTDPFR